MRFIHTADWQIGKPFRSFGEREATLRVARLQAIETIGRLAVEHGIAHVLVAGDVYDSEAPLGKTLLEPVERMRGFRTIVWHLIRNPVDWFPLYHYSRHPDESRDPTLSLGERLLELSPVVRWVPTFVGMTVFVYLRK